MPKQLPWMLLALCLSGAAVNDAGAAELQVGVEIPRMNVAEYHRPYVAVWIQDENRKVAANLSVWYQMKSPGDEVGHKWLPDLRQWWRRSGRSLELPIDGVSGATRPVGQHDLTFDAGDKPLTKLKPGKYTLVVEAAREVGGREMVEIPFAWPLKESFEAKVKGESELGEVTLTFRP